MGKKLLTFLGTNRYDETTYFYKDFKLTTRFIQHALARYLIEKEGEEIEYLVFLTEKAKKENWLGEGKNYDGLQKILQNEGIQYREIDVNDGGSKEDMWDIFEKIYENLDQNDEIYVDITHSFRSLPLIMMSVLNYTKFIKNIKINKIFYGAYDPRSTEKETPILDLTLFDKINDWAVGAEKLITTGDGEKFSEIASTTVGQFFKNKEHTDFANLEDNMKKINSLNDNLMYFSRALKTARGEDSAVQGYNLKQKLLALKEVKFKELKPFEKILDKVLARVEYYDDTEDSKNLLKNVHHTICLCRDFGLLQQAYTLLAENIINYVCLKSGLDNIKIQNKESRIIAKDVLCSFNKKKNITLNEYGEKYREKLKTNTGTDLVVLADFFNDVTYFRNDLNHGGFRSSSPNYSTIINKLDEFIERSEKLLLSDENLKGE